MRAPPVATLPHPGSTGSQRRIHRRLAPPGRIRISLSKLKLWRCRAISGKEVARRPSADEAHQDERAAPSPEVHREEASEGDASLASYRTQLATLDMRCRILIAELEESRQLQQGAVAASSTAQVCRTQIVGRS